MSEFELAEAHDTVNLLRAGAVAKIELNRPDELNAWNQQMSADLLATLTACEADDEIRAVLVAGAGRGFSSGADLKNPAGQPPPYRDRPDVYRSLVRDYHPVIRGVRSLPKPVVAAVTGPCAGVGLSLALASDFVVAAESSYFLLAFVHVGLVPDGGASMLLPRRVGFARATEMAMLGERIGAPQALEWGLINRVHPDDELHAAAAALAAQLAAGPTLAYAGAKRQLNASVWAGLEDQLELEARIQREMAASADFVEGVTAFAEKRPPAFSGR